MKIIPRKSGYDEKKDYICCRNRLLFPKIFVICTRFQNVAIKKAKRRDARVVEEARLESV